MQLDSWIFDFKSRNAIAPVRTSGAREEKTVGQLSSVRRELLGSISDGKFSNTTLKERESVVSVDQSSRSKQDSVIGDY